ncbi:hypothetical protein KC343_g1622, partial [Hortaea werneckii]
GFYTRSLALVADAFHYLNDLVGFIVALVALKNTIMMRKKLPASRKARIWSFPYRMGEQRGPLHDNHRHETLDRSRRGKDGDLGIMGVLIHVGGDAANNIGVIIAGAVIWKTKSPRRYYADPAVSVAIALMIFFSSIPLVKKSGLILLESAPSGVKPQDIKHDIEKLDGVIAVHELHVWRLNQQKTLASAHITVSETQLKSFQALARSATECFHAYGIHGVTLQPELAPHMIAILNEGAEPGGSSVNLRERRFGDGTCLLRCDAEGCVSPSCCE